MDHLHPQKGAAAGESQESLVKTRCQLQILPEMGEQAGLKQHAWGVINRLRRLLKRRLRYIKNTIRETIIRKPELLTIGEKTIPLQPGDLVRVKTKNEIQKTLNRWNQLGGCGFMEEMWPYCGTTQRVFKRVSRFLDERDYRIKKSRQVVILEGVYCTGTIDFGRCDRSCFLFWREEWLERIS
jgi:hypothetical protein